MVKNPETNFGFITVTVDGNPTSLFTNHQACHFHSSEAADTSLTPRLVVTGSAGTKVTAGSTARRLFQIRCSRNAFSVYVQRQAPYWVSVTDYKGRMLISMQGKTGWTRIPCDFAHGLYCVTVQSEGMRRTQRVTVY